MSGFIILVKAGADAASSSVIALGSAQHIITDGERNTFKITDQSLKNAVGSYFGRNPDDAFLHSDTPWGDLYRSYGWDQVQTVMVPQSATITGITTNPEIIARNDLRNDSPVTGTFNAGVTTQVSNTTSSNWSESSTVSFKESISLKVGLEGIGDVSHSMELGFSETFGVGGSDSQTIAVGSTQSVSVTLQPHQSVEARLQSTRGTMSIRVVYRAYLMGDVAVNYSDPFKGHHFWALPIDGVMGAAGIPNTTNVTQDVQIGYYCNASVSLVGLDSHGQSMKVAQAIAA